MQTTKSVIRRPGARTKRLEKIVRGFSNHRRIEILELLAAHPELCLGEISEKLQIEIRTASEHLRRLTASGLVLKRYTGRKVRHGLTERSHRILKFLEALD
jgi:DNA-binding transcriptional ArsR family regulator